jgi:hypothetical protein
VEESGKKLTWAQEVRDPGEEIKERQLPQIRPRMGVNIAQEPSVFISHCPCCWVSLLSSSPA